MPPKEWDGGGGGGGIFEEVAGVGAGAAGTIGPTLYTGGAEVHWYNVGAGAGAKAGGGAKGQG